jgi:diaminopimelate epimerase
MHTMGKAKKNAIKINVEGGKLTVTFEEKNGVYKNIFLTGPVAYVFSGKIEI